jgi:hypothetical protein
LTRRDNQISRLRASFFAAIITTAATPDSHPDCRALLIKIVALHISSFVSGIVKDIAAVRAAIALPWSNGQTEGQITKLKLVKRQMYGRAKIDLLQARLIGAI